MDGKHSAGTDRRGRGDLPVASLVGGGPAGMSGAGRMQGWMERSIRQSVGGGEERVVGGHFPCKFGAETGVGI